MKAIMTLTGVGALCMAGLLTGAAILCDMAGSALVDIGSPQ